MTPLALDHFSKADMKNGLRPMLSRCFWWLFARLVIWPAGLALTALSLQAHVAAVLIPLN